MTGGRAWVYGVVAIAASAVYLPSLQAGLVSDDFFFTQRPWPLNPATLLATGWEHQLGKAVGYRPVTLFSYAINQLLQSPPWAFHAVNVALHAAASVALVAWARTLGLGVAGALVAGLSFALHPVHHEGVAWIAGRTVVLSTALALAALAVIGRNPNHPVRRWSSAGIALIALLAYEGALVLPMMLWATAAVVAPGRRFLSATRATVPAALLWLAYLLLRWTVWSSPADDLWASSAAVHEEGFAAPVLQRLVSNTSGWITRLGAAGIGVPAAASLTFWVTVGLTVASAGPALGRSATRRVLALAWVCGGLAFVPFATYTGYADRFAYFSSVAVCLTLALGAHVAARSTRLVRVVAAMVFAVMCLLWSRQLLLAQRDWVEAGRIAAAVQHEAVQTMPYPPQTAQLHFVGVPLAIRGAYVYITYFDLAIRQAYGRDDVVASIDPNPDGPCRLRDGSEPWACLRWNASSRTFHVSP